MIGRLEQGKGGGWIEELRRSYGQGKGENKRKKAGRESADSERVSAPEFKADPIISEVFLRTLSRPPTAEEMTKAREDIVAAGNPINGVRDLLWAMLNTREFMVNH